MCLHIDIDNIYLGRFTDKLQLPHLKYWALHISLPKSGVHNGVRQGIVNGRAIAEINYRYTINLQNKFTK